MDGLGRPGRKTVWTTERLDGLLEEFHRAGATDEFLVWLAYRESVTIETLRKRLNRHVDETNRRIRNGNKAQACNKEKVRK